MTSLNKSLTDVVTREALVPLDRIQAYSVDGYIPSVAVLPSTVEEMAKVMTLASDQRLKVMIKGGGTQMSLGNRTGGLDVVIGTSRLNRLISHEPADVTATVGAGMTLASVQARLSYKGQFLPLEAPFPDLASIGGILASDASGPFRMAYGTARDWLIGVQVIHGDGTISRSGGKVVKNVTGYDLDKLYVGSLGTLGIIVEATFKLAPIPSYRHATIGTIPSASSANNLAKEMLNSRYYPHSLQVINWEAMKTLDKTFPVRNDGMAIIAVYSGRKAVVERQVNEATKLMKHGGATNIRDLPTPHAENLLQAGNNLGWENDPMPQLVLKVTALPSAIRAIINELPSLVSPLNCPGMIADMGFGQIRLIWWDNDGESRDGSVELGVVTKLREITRISMGHVVVERCTSSVSNNNNMDVWGEIEGGIGIMRRIKKELDPSNILNAGRFVGGL